MSPSEALPAGSLACSTPRSSATSSTTEGRWPASGCGRRITPTKCHVYHPGGRTIAEPREPLRKLRDSHLLTSGGVGPLHLLDWDYRVAPDKPNRRRTLVIDLEQVDEPTMVSLWAVEKHRDDLVSEVLERRPFVLLAHALTEWTQPMLLATVTQLASDAWEQINAGYLQANPGTPTPTVANPSDGSVGP